jgi:hypothetical protein
VDFFDGTRLLESARLDTRGTASLTVRLNLGGHRLRAAYGGGDSFAGSVSGWKDQAVGRAAATVTFAAVPPAGGDGVTLRAEVRTRFAGSPIGTVTFRDGNRVLGTAAVNGAGVATLKLGPLGSGRHHLTAAYSGSSCFLGATSDPLDLTVPG